MSVLKNGLSPMFRLLAPLNVVVDEHVVVVNAFTAGEAKRASESAVENFIVYICCVCVDGVLSVVCIISQLWMI